MSFASFANQHRLVLSLLSVVIGSAVIIPACDPKLGGPEDPTQLVFLAGPTEVRGGQSITVSASMKYGADIIDGDITYSVPAADQAFATIDARSGVLTAALTQTVAERAITVTAAGIAPGRFQDPPNATTTIQVRSRVSAVSVATQGITLTTGTQTDIPAVVSYAAGAPTSPAATIVWSSSNTALAAVDANGKITAVAVTPAGQPVSITAKAEGVTSAVIAVTVLPGLTPAIVVSPKTKQLNINFEQQLTAQVVNPAPGAVNAIWISRDPTKVSVSAVGLVTALLPTAQPVYVVASYTGGSLTVRDSAAITVAAPSITLTPRNRELQVGDQLQYAAAVTNPAIGSVLVDWQSRNPARVSVSGTGLVTAVSATLVTQPVWVVATYVAGSTTVRDSVNVSVVAAPPSIAVSPRSITAQPGQTRLISTVVTNGQAPITVDFVSRDPAVATVTASGTSGVVNAKANGSTFIVASYTQGSTTVRDSSRITVAGAVAGLVLDPLELTVPAGTVVPYRALLLDDAGNVTSPASGYHVIYTAGNSQVAEVASGDNTTGRILAKAGGYSHVNAYYVPIAGGGTPQFSATSTLHVANSGTGAVAAVRITTNHLLASPGTSFGLTAVALDAGGSPVNGVTFRWSSTIPSLVSVSAGTGQASANQLGGALVFASAVLPNNDEGPTGITAVTVRTAGAVMANVSVPNGASSVVAAGATIRAYTNGVNVSSGVVALAAATPGRAYIPGLIPGTYTVTVSLPGYALQTFPGVVVTAENITSLNGGNTIVLVPTP